MRVRNTVVQILLDGRYSEMKAQIGGEVCSSHDIRIVIGYPWVNLRFLVAQHRETSETCYLLGAFQEGNSTDVVFPPFHAESSGPEDHGMWPFFMSPLQINGLEYAREVFKKLFSFRNTGVSLPKSRMDEEKAVATIFVLHHSRYAYVCEGSHGIPRKLCGRKEEMFCFFVYHCRKT